MSQQQTVSMPNGSEYEWNPIKRQYDCIHAHTETENNSFDHAFGTKRQKNIICLNPECREDVTNKVVLEEEDS